MKKIKKKNKLKVGIIGGGINSTIGRAHLSALRMDGCYEITSGFFSRNKETNNKTLNSLNLTSINYNNDFKEYVINESNKIDVFLILSNTFGHLDHIKYLSDFKKPIICEKPTSINIDELKHVTNIFNNKNINYFPIYNYTGYPIIRDIKNFIKKNLLGYIHSIELKMPQQSLTKKKIGNTKKWRLEDLTVPTIQLDLGVHLLSLLKFIFPNIKINKVISYEQIFKNKNLVHTVNSWIELNSGAICKIFITKNDIGERNNLSIKINGTNGSLKWQHADPENLILYNETGKKVILDRNDNELTISKEKRYNRYSVGHPYGFIESLANYYYDIYLYLSNKDKKSKKYLISLEDENFIMQIIKKLHESYVKKKWINIK